MVLKFSGTLSKPSRTEDVVFAGATKHDIGEEEEEMFMKQVPFLLYSESVENTSSK